MKTQVTLTDGKIMVELPNGSTDFPIQYDDGDIAYDFPERIPMYAKKKVQQLFYKLARENPLKNKPAVLEILRMNSLVAKDVPLSKASKGKFLWSIVVENFHGFDLQIDEYVSLDYKEITFTLYKNGEFHISTAAYGIKDCQEELDYITEFAKE